METKHHHSEKHFTSSEVVRDVIIGMTDGLTVPFALTAGLKGAIKTVLIGALVAGAAFLVARLIS